MVDHNVTLNNFLFRGSYPGDAGDGDLDYNTYNTFNYSLLKNSIIDLSKKLNLTNFPTDFYLIDITFLNKLNPKDVKLINLEETFFSENPELGGVINWPIYGRLKVFTNASKLIKFERENMVKIYKDWDADMLDQRIEKINEMIHLNYGKSVVVFGHCYSGLDRTGEFFGSYRMRYFIERYNKVLRNNNVIANRKIRDMSSIQLNW